jgi:plastocyanin
LGKASQRKQSLVSTQPAPNTAYGNPAPTQQASDPAIMVGMTASRFTPDMLTIKACTTVIWTNGSSLIHTVTSDTDRFDSGNGRGGYFPLHIHQRGSLYLPLYFVKGVHDRDHRGDGLD